MTTCEDDSLEEIQKMDTEDKILLAFSVIELVLALVAAVAVVLIGP